MKVCLPNLSSFLVLLLLHRALSFLIRNKRPMNTRWKSNQTNITNLACLLFIEMKEDFLEIIPVLTNLEEISGKCHMIETGEVILPSGIDSEIRIIQKGSYRRQLWRSR